MQPMELKAARQELGMTQHELAEALGLTPQFIGMMERGEKAVEPRTALSVSYLLGQWAAERLFKANDPDGYAKWVADGRKPMNPKWEQQVSLVLQAIRVPSEKMLEAAARIDLGPNVQAGGAEYWQAMIDAALSERS